MMYHAPQPPSYSPAQLPDYVDLNFFVVDAEPLVQEVFRDRVARTIWLGVKWNHIVDQNFTANCLEVSKAVKDRMVDGRWLSAVLQRLHMIGTSETTGEVLAPYVNGRKDLRWKERGIEVPA